MRNIVLYIGMSLDGFIAKENGDVAWLEGQDAENSGMGSYPEFIQTVDTVILGYTTYRQVVEELSPDEWPYEGKQTYVLTHKELEPKKGICFTNEKIQNLLERLRNEPGKDIWICGGANVVNQVVKLNLIDRYWLTIIPTILGNGIRLFDMDNPELKLKLISTQSYNGMTDLIYERR